MRVINTENSFTVSSEGYGDYGLYLIAKERVEQIIKHGFNKDHDNKYEKDELLKASLYMLFFHYRDLFPEGSLDHFYDMFPWSDYWRKKFEEKDCAEALVIIGAMIAAQLDVLHSNH